ncbi:MAG: response regulator transcription factor, partial [Williamsia herbipolensis]|nr:response regulator transcription factor [Williamsia herbipolensis]
MKVLLLEDDDELGPAVVDGLRDDGFVVDLVTTRQDADVQRSVARYDCVVLDRTVPDAPGGGPTDAMGIVDAMRREGDTTPTLLLTARDRVSDRVAGFEHGADDYLTKPFAFAELVMRIRALARRGHDPAPPVRTAGDIALDTARHTVQRAGVRLTLTAKEFSVLEVLLERPGDAITRDELLARCWDEMATPGSNVVDVLVGQLRRRLGAPDPIESVRGVGY